MNAAEARPWWDLRHNQLGVRFRRQPPILGFIPDFACLPLKIVIEVDGSQHRESEKDRIRDSVLAAHGWRVLRFWSWDVFKENEAVLSTIAHAVAERSALCSEGSSGLGSGGSEAGMVQLGDSVTRI